MMIIFTFEHGTVSMTSDKVYSSKYITVMLKIYEVCKIQSDTIEINVPKPYYETIHFYFTFLNDKTTNNINITDVKQLFTSLLIANYFGDNTYFQHLIKECHKIWSKFESSIPLFPQDIQKEIYLYTPYEFVPKWYLSDSTFFERWLYNNKNKETILNGSEKYHTKIQYHDNGKVMMFETYHTVNEEKIGYSQIQSWYYQGGLCYITEYYNDKAHGTNLHWYENGKIKRECTYSDGKLHGVLRMWYENGKLSEESKYVNGELHGISRSWYENGQPRKDGNFVNNKRHGMWTKWYVNGQIKYRGKYHQGKKRGLWKGWYENGDPKYKGYCHDK